MIHLRLKTTVLLTIATLTLVCLPHQVFGVRRQTIDEVLKKIPYEVPEGHTVEAEWAEHRDAGQFITKLTTYNDKKQEDGIMAVTGRYGWVVIRAVPKVKGKNHGLERQWTQNNFKRTLAKEVPWVDDEVHGVVKSFHANGRVQSETTYEHGTPVGQSKSYDLTGRLTRVISYEDGERHGEQIDYWPLTGKPKRIVPYVKGDVEGTVKDFYDKGQLKRSRPVHDDMFHGIEHRYDEDGVESGVTYWFKDEKVSKEDYDKLMAESKKSE